MPRSGALRDRAPAPAPAPAKAPAPAPVPLPYASFAAPPAFEGNGAAAHDPTALGGNTIALLRGMTGDAPALESYGPAEQASTPAPTTPAATSPAPDAAAPEGFAPGDAGAAAAPEAGTAAASEAGAADAAAAPGAQTGERAPAASGGGGGGGGSEALRILGRSRPSDAAANVATARASAAAEVSRDRASLAAAPPSLEAPSGLERPGEGQAPATEEPGTAGEQAARVEDAEGAGAAPPEPETGHVVSRAPVPEGPSPDAVVDRAPDDPAARAERYRAMIAAMPASDDSVSTDPGPPPPLLLTEEADPGRVGEQAARNETALGTEFEAARRGMAEDEGVDDIYATLPDEMLVAPVSPGGSRMVEVAQPGSPALRPGVRAGYDEGLAPRWSQEVAAADADHAAAMQKRRGDEAAKRAETKAEIARLESEAATEQEGHRDQARTDVAAARAGWQSELDAARGTYDGERGRIDRDMNRDVAAKVADAEGKAQAHLDAGKARADAKRIEVEGEAERRRAEAERRRDEADGFFDWVASKVKGFFAALQRGLKMLFDGLRRAVRAFIEGAKKLAAAAIELGRRAVVGLIRLAGAALELACDVFLAAFPKARDRAKALIREGTGRAEAAVNRAAEALREAAFAALDALGDALCFILDVYEAFYSTLFSVFEALVVGFVEVARALYRLDLAAEYAPGEIEGQVYEEMIGADLTQPLVFEATASEIAGWEAGGQGGTGLEAGMGADAAAGLAAPAMPGDVVAEPVVDFQPDPELLAGHDFAQGPIEFEGAAGPGTSLAELYGEARDSEASPAAGSDGGDTALPAEADGGPGSAIPGATTDEKLDHYIAQGAPRECRNDTPKGPEGPPMPLSAKIGPLTKSQRARYMLSQAWSGIKHWVSCNWPTILAAVLAAIVVIAAIVAVVVLSGGTVGVALSALLTAFTGAMIIYAIARAAGFLLDYLQKSIDGDIIGGAKGLARALAVAAVEIIFAILTYVTAGVFRGIAAGIKGAGRLAAGAARGAGRLAAGAARQVGRGARAAGRGAARLGGGALRATGRVGSAVVRRGKLVIRNVRQGFERGARSVRDLGRRLARRLPFRRYRIILRNRWIVLQGQINPWIDIAKMDASVWVEEVTENLSRTRGRPRSGDIIRGTTEAGEEVTGRVFAGSRSRPGYRDLARQRGLRPTANVIHHAIEQQVLKRFKNLFTRAEINSASRLRAISKGAYNARVHLSQVRRLWDQMYTAVRSAGLTAAKQRQALEAFMRHVDGYLDAMQTFSKTNAAFRAAEQAKDTARMRSLLDAENARLMAQPRFDTAKVIDDILKGL